MSDQQVYELQYQAWLKRHLNKILLCAFILVISGFVYETYTYFQSNQQKAAQSLFESYLDIPNTEVALELKAKHPNSIQTHLVLFLDAKEAYTNQDIDKAIEDLDFVYKHSKEVGIQKIAAYRLAHLYLEKQDKIKAQAVLKPLDEDAYSTLQLALTIDDPDERMETLDKAFSISDSPYINKMIATLHNDIIEP